LVSGALLHRPDDGPALRYIYGVRVTRGQCVIFTTSQHPTERIDPETNAVFEGCSRPWEIEDAYEAYWNRINDTWEYEFPPGKEKVKVLRVVEVAPGRRALN